MRHARTATLAVTAAVLLAGCSSSTGDTAPADSTAVPSRTAAPTSTRGPASTTVPATTARTTAPTAAPAALPAFPVPAQDGTCPYLSADDVAAFNGEKVFGVKLDPAYTPPACAFLRGDGGVQLTVWVYRAGSAAQAKAAVDRAAPVATTDPADQPAGWIGGSSGGAAGGVYAVAKGAVAVVVTTNQEQSVKARRVTEQVITALKL